MNFPATTAMIIPIAIAVVMELNKQRLHISLSRATLQSGVSMRPIGSSSTSDLELTKLPEIGTVSSAVNIADVSANIPDLDNLKFEDFPKRQQEIAKALILSVAYASSIGGKFRH